MLAHGKSVVYLTEGKYSALFSSLKQLRQIIHRKPLSVTLSENLSRITFVPQ